MAKVCKLHEDDLPILKGLLQHGTAPEYMTVRFGRVPKREKARIIAAMQSVQSKSRERSFLSELEDEEAATRTIIQAYLDTCEFTEDKIRRLRNQALLEPIYNHDPQSTSCPLFPTNESPSMQSTFSVRFSKAVRGVINFALRLPSFTQIPPEDRFLLLKSGAFEALLVSLAGLYDNETKTFLCMNGRLMRRETVYSPSNTNSNSIFLMNSMCKYAERMNGLGLSDAELALFTAVVIVAPDRHGIRHKDLIERLHNRLSTFLQNLLLRNHPEYPDLYQTLLRFIDDLKTFNTLHSDKYFCQKKMEQHSNSNNMWDDSRFTYDDKEGNISSPTSSYAPDEGIQSPTYSESISGESGSSEGSLCGNEVSTYMEIQASFSQHRRHREPSEGNSSGDEIQDSLGKCPFNKRKVDSSEDSGIESDKLSTPSICSSPRSSIDEKIEEDREEDMPVLRRALQAPPIMNTDLIMEEAYKPHKKFRAFRREEPHSSLSGCQSSSSILAQTLSQPLSHSTDQSSSLLASALSSPSLAKSLSEQPKMSEDSLRKADMLHSLIVKNESICQRGQRSHNHSHTSPAPYYVPHSAMDRLQPPTSSSSSAWSTSEDCRNKRMLSPARESITTLPRLHLLTSPTPSRYYEPRVSVSAPLGLGSQTSTSPKRGSSPPQGFGAHSPPSSQTAIMELQVDISDAQPLNLSKKTPPPTPDFMIEV